jgi:hypothetical protein
MFLPSWRHGNTLLPKRPTALDSNLRHPQEKTPRLENNNKKKEKNNFFKNPPATAYPKDIKR